MSPLNVKNESCRDAQWLKLARSHDLVLYRHSILVAELCGRFTEFLDRPLDQQTALRRAGLLHDIGKLKVPAAILQRPSSLTTEEMSIVQKHAQYGYEMLLEAGETDELLLTVTRDHHERLDGAVTLAGSWHRQFPYPYGSSLCAMYLQRSRSLDHTLQQ